MKGLHLIPKRTHKENIKACKIITEICADALEKGLELTAEVVTSAVFMPFTLVASVLDAICFFDADKGRKTMRKKNFKH